MVGYQWRKIVGISMHPTFFLEFFSRAPRALEFYGPYAQLPIVYLGPIEIMGEARRALALALAL